MFGKLFGKSQGEAIEERIIREMTESLTATGFPTNKAREISRGMLNNSKDELVKAGRGTTLYQLGDGDLLLRGESKNENFRGFLSARRRHGVTDEDIRRWHNLCELERSVIMGQDQWLIVSTYKAAISEGASEVEAARLAAKAHARYTPNAEHIGSKGHEDLLPVELKLRVNEYRSRLIAENPQRFKKELEDATDFNGWVREKLSTGEL